MTAVKVGDRVRATCGESVIIGTVTNCERSWIHARIDGDNGTRTFARTLWAVKVLAPPIPDVVGTIVRDRDGDAWQYERRGKWETASGPDFGVSDLCLDDLKRHFGPLVVLHVPEAKAP